MDSSDDGQEKRIKWWPYRFLPSPYILGSTLFPTLCTWSEKSIWDKFVSVISAPSIFLLAVTLPVVESEPQNQPEEDVVVDALRRSSTRTRSGTVPMLTPDSPSLEEEPEWIRYRRATETRGRTISPQPRGFSGHSTAAIAVSTENLHHHSHSLPMPLKQNSIDQQEVLPSVESSEISPRDWNRWLVAVQIFTAPLFVVLIVWANSEDGNPRFLFELVLYSLLGSLIVFGILALTTTPDKPPKYRFLFCFLGFVVSIAWISTIANEVVGVLKAFGVILGISDAILGLTIFAVGNSLGDLVADITVARLGYPVMALSACFGGPMLNILLGIGISGLYMTIKEANSKHEKHPGHKLKYKPYEIEVSGTLMVSGITLLVTLVGLLIAVPMNKWVMSRRIGWGLIILWSISTVINLAVEISGVWDDPISLH
jgi:sodium/potassium/calcium exchanger 6